MKLRKIVIVGAGPAGSSLAIRLAIRDFDVTLVEREIFPRPKLCGEFISPECLGHLAELRVLDSMTSAGGDRISETVFFSQSGRSATIPTSWLGGIALSLSRSEMDHQLLRRAEDTGVRVMEDTSVVDVMLNGPQIAGVRARAAKGEAFTVDGDVTVDATGRSAIVSKLAARAGKVSGRTSDKAKFIGFKVHMRNASIRRGRCEMYFFRGGYAGLSNVENGLFNLCFLVEARAVREMKSDVGEILGRVVFQNPRAKAALENAEPVGEWLAVSVTGFGRKPLSPAPGLFTVGDSAAFIDPFTGSGMLLAFESAQMLAHSIADDRHSFASISHSYSRRYHTAFASRLRSASLLRRAAFVPVLASSAIRLAGVNERLTELAARLTRRSASTAFTKR